MNVPFNVAPQGWQCPCCKTIYAPSVAQCAPCSGAALAPPILPQPIVIPTVWPSDDKTDSPWLPPYEVTSDSITIVATDLGGWLINGEGAHLVPTDWRAH